MQTISKRLSKLIYTFFFLSGMTGLIYQVLWAKYLSNIFGSSAYAHTIVLAVFMGGLAFGNYFLGRLADRSKLDLLYLYGGLEIGIGVYCMVYPNIADGIERLYETIGQSLHVESTHGGLLLTQFILNAVTILIPTTLMGGTLPVMVKYITRSRSEILNKVSVLYFINSAGAVLGSLFCGFFFIRLWGMDTSISFAAILNTLIGFCAIGISRRLSEDEKNSPVTVKEKESDTFTSPEDQTKSILILWAIGASGFASMLYEVIWIRTLIQFFGSSVYSFAIVVAAFIAGITIGSAWLTTRQQKIKDLYFFFALTEGLIAITMFICVKGLDFFVTGIWFLHQLFSPVPFAYPFFLFAKFLMAFVILFVPSFFIGMTLPLASAICSKNLKILGREVGGVFSANTIGAVVGTAMAGLVLLPVIGIADSFFIGICINLLIAIILLGTFRKQKIYLRTVMAFGVSLIIFLSWPLTIERASMLSSMFRIRTNTTKPFNEYLRQFMIDKKILFFKEGNDSNVAVVQIQNKDIVLYINGKADASSSGDMPTQLLSGHIPALLHKNPKKALVIGFGSGVTVGALTLYPSIEQIDCLEISKAVIEAGVYFKNFNNDVLNNKKVRIIVDDAKNFLSFNNEKYDVIISEPTNPWTAGTGSLLTKEAFARIRKALKDDGVFLQWFHGYEMSPDLFRNFVFTLTQSMPFVSVWEPMETDYFFISQFQPLKVDYERIKTELASNPKVVASLKQIKADNIFSILSAQIISNERTRDLFNYGIMNRDRFPIIEFNAPKAFFLHQNVVLTENDERIRPPEQGQGLALVELLNIQRLEDKDIKALYSFFKETAQPVFTHFTRTYAQQLKSLFTDDVNEQFNLEKFLVKEDSDQVALNRIKKLADETNSAVVFLDYIKMRITVYFAKHSLFSNDLNERQNIERLLLEAPKRFPEGKADLAFHLAGFYSFHNEHLKALGEYLGVVLNIEKDTTPKAQNKAREALLLATDLGIRDRNPQTLAVIKELAEKYFPGDLGLRQEIKQRENTLIN